MMTLSVRWLVVPFLAASSVGCHAIMDWKQSELIDAGLDSQGGDASDEMHAGDDADAETDVADTGRDASSDANLPTGPTGHSCDPLESKCQGGNDCCTTLLVEGGTFPMGRSTEVDGTDSFDNGGQKEIPEHDATVGPYYMDMFEVTVGRFRAFLNQYDTWRKEHPVAGSGKIPGVEGSGWKKEWNGFLPASSKAFANALAASAQNHTWTDEVGSSENHPINSITWYEAYAFCIWDGGRLPTEAEWEYAAAGGSNNFRYPWGPGSPTSSLANYLSSAHTPKKDVGSYPDGRGRFGQYDLAGSVAEWVLDNLVDYDDGPCAPCFQQDDSSLRVVRGGSWASNASGLRCAARLGMEASRNYETVGFRCVRDIPDE